MEHLTIREYKSEDEDGWLRCHTLAYLGTRERRLERSKPTYSGRTIELVALVNDKIVGFLDIELEDTSGGYLFQKIRG